MGGMGNHLAAEIPEVGREVRVRHRPLADINAAGHIGSAFHDRLSIQGLDQGGLAGLAIADEDGPHPLDLLLLPGKISQIAVDGAGVLGANLLGQPHALLQDLSIDRFVLEAVLEPVGPVLEAGDTAQSRQELRLQGMFRDGIGSAQIGIGVPGLGQARQLRTDPVHESMVECDGDDGGVGGGGAGGAGGTSDGGVDGVGGDDGNDGDASTGGDGADNVGGLGVGA